MSVISIYYLNSFAQINDRLTLIFTYWLALKAIQGVESVTVYNYLDDCILQVVLQG